MNGSNSKTRPSREQALAFLKDNRNTEARAAFAEIVKAHPRDAEAWYYLGIVEARLGAYEQAAQCLREATARQPGFGQAWHWLGNVLSYAGKAPESARAYEQFAQLAPGNAMAWNKFGRACVEMSDYTRAEQCFRRAAQAQPDSAEAYASLGQLCGYHGRPDEAADFYRRALALDPASPRAAIGAFLTLPVIYRDADHLRAARAAYRQGLEELNARLEVFRQRKGLIAELDWSNNFYLAYQGEDDRELQAMYGAFFRELAAVALPQFMSPLPPSSAKGRRIRVGYVSHYFSEHTVSYYFNGWIAHADRDRFETFVYHVDPRPDGVSQALASACDHYRPLAGLIPAMAQAIRRDDLDVLVYPEIGMYPKHLWLAALRLAPVQCAAWGHPVTTGLASMDYYLSSAATEPPEAASHYTETLACLDGIGICSAPAAVPPDGTREQFGLPVDRTLYLCSQSLFKVHVEMDALLAQVAAGDPSGLILFFEDTKPDFTRAFRERVERRFSARGLSLERQVRFLPRRGHADYLRLSRLCDLMLDTLHWSGGRTSLDALACGLPIVTLPGRFSRGRQTGGMLRELGLEELVATDAEDYVRLAVELGRDRDRRRRLSETILRCAPGVIFDNLGPVRSLEQFFRDAVSSSD
jgi:predicted O-linked N-acetylglucosamine transferase (SPINDLY family)